MIEAYMGVDLDNPLAVRYHEPSLKSFESVSDVFKINVIQCITPKTLLDLKLSSNKGRSPQEEAHIHSTYRLMKRIASGERFWIMEHDAYLFPKEIDIFRMIMLKYREMPMCNIGIALECYTVIPEIATMFCNHVENDDMHNSRGPMGILHAVTDLYCKANGNNRNNVYWPKKGMDNRTGISTNVPQAHVKPSVILNSPVTQLIDEGQGTTVTDRSRFQGNNKFYNSTTHPNFHFVTL